MSSISKISRLSAAVRDELNRRLRDGQHPAVILPWINNLPEVRRVLKAHFEGREIEQHNLSRWRRNEFRAWNERCEQTSRVKELAASALELAQAKGGTVAEGAAAIASGKILELLQAVDDVENRDQIHAVVASLARLRTAEISQQRANTDRERLKRKDEELSLAKQRFQRETCELFITWAAKKRALELANAPMSNEVKIEKLGRLMFGDLWERAKR